MYADKPIALPFFTGHGARDLLLRFIRQVDLAASGLLHELNVSNPYSVTPLRFSKNRTRDGACFGSVVSLQGGF